MAALQSIRKRSGLLVGIIAVGLLAFVLPWNEISMSINKSRDKAFTVDGEVIPTKDYSDRIQQWENFQKTVTNESSLREEISSIIRELTYQQMVTELILDEQAEKLGLAVTASELNEIVKDQNFGMALQNLRLFINPNTGNLEGIASLFANPQTGQYDSALLAQFLNYINTPISQNMPAQTAQDILAKKDMWSFIERMLEYQILQEKYSVLVAGTFLPSNTEAKTAFEDSKIQADIAYVLQPYATIPDSIVAKEVTDAEVKALYEQRKNSFKIDTELRKLSYFVKDVIPSTEDYDIVAAEMAKAYDKLVAAENPAAVVSEYSAAPYADAYLSLSALPIDVKNFVETASIGQVSQPERSGQAYAMYKLVNKTVAPDSVKIRIIPLPQGLDSKVAAHISDSLLNVVKGGKDFATLADETMPGSTSIWVTEIMLSGTGNDFAKKCFGASKGEILNITANGQTQLVQIEDKTNPVQKVKIAAVQMPVIVSDKTQNAIDNELNQFVTESGNLENFSKAAQSKGYNIISEVVISPSEMNLSGVSGSRQVIHWAFNEKKGTVNKFDLSDKRIIAIINDEIKGGYMPLSEVSSLLKAELIKDKKAAKMIADLKAKNLTTLNAYAEAVSGRVDTVNFVTFQTNNISGLGFEPIINVYSKLGQVNKVEQPVKGNAGVYVLDVISKTESPNTFDPVQAKQIARQSNFYQLASQAIYALKGKMDVKDNRVVFW